jgi:hypothetical protein
MRPTPFYFFEYLPEGAKKPKRTTYRMTVEEAAERLPGAVPIEWTKEIRNLPGPGEWLGPGQHSRYMAGPLNPQPVQMPRPDLPADDETPPAPAP